MTIVCITDSVATGLLKVTVQSNSGSCEIQARSQSDIQVFFGFVTDPRNDKPSTYANIQSSKKIEKVPEDRLNFQATTTLLLIQLEFFHTPQTPNHQWKEN